MANIIIIDDDFAMESLKDNLLFRGHEANRIKSVSEAKAKIDQLLTADLVVLDILMPGGSGKPWAGMEVFREIRACNKQLPIIAYSSTQDANLKDVLSDDQHTTFISKWDTSSMRDIVDAIYKKLGLNHADTTHLSFIVHGRNNTMKLALKNYIQNTLKLPEPIILHEQPNQGRTIIEKFEEYAAQSCFVFVLLTPDDVVASPSDPEESKHRARQNVIFEMGYFLGILGRRSGRVLLLHQGSIELPSDISGVVYINISNGIEAAGEVIRRELQHVT